MASRLPLPVCELLVVLLVSCVAGGAWGQPAVPVVPAQFSGIVDVSVVTSSSSLAFEGASYYFDAPNKRTTISNLTMAVPNNPNYALRVTAHVVPGSLFYVNNGVCREYPGGWNNMYAWLQSSKVQYTGQTTIRGRVCDVFMYKSATFIGSVAAQGNTLVQYNSTVILGSVSSATSFYYYPGLVNGPSPASVFKVPQRCYGPGFVCPHATVANVSMIRFHTESYWGLDNKNTADLTGDTVFICTTVATNTHTNDQLISLFDVQLNTGFGRYGKCNGGYCYGSNNFTVGRSAAWTASVPPGQCTVNYKFGTWYSMTKATHCAAGQAVGDGCAWAINRRIKTINGSCAFDTYGMLAACNAEPTFPFTSAAAALRRAIEGCPALTPPSEDVFQLPHAQDHSGIWVAPSPPSQHQARLDEPDDQDAYFAQAMHKWLHSMQLEFTDQSLRD